MAVSSRSPRAPRNVIQLVLGELGQAADGIPLVELDQPDALGVAADGAHRADLGADDHAAAGREHDLVVVGDLADGDDRPVALVGLDVDQALAAAVLGAVLGQQGPLAVAVGADGQEAGRVLVAVGDDHADDLVPLGQVDPLDAVGRPAHRADP